jgi:predicted RNA binding protein YcfA (HicA-like mRNA interferase family)
MRRYSSDKDLARFIKQLVAVGWSFRRGGKHNRLTSPAGVLIVAPVSPSDRRCLMNLKSTVRRAVSGSA